MAKQENKHSNFIVQGGILAVTGIISRLIGLLYRVPLQKTIGDAGMGYYSAAFQIYSVMLIISSYSLPVAVSKLVAARAAKGQYKNARKIYHGALLFAIISGGTTCLIVFFGADALAGTLMNLPKSAIALQLLAPTLLIVAVMGVIRGYFQGLGTMMPTAASQLIEQIVNAVVSVAAAIYLFEYGSKVADLLRDEAYASAYGAAGGTLGTGVGAVAGLIVLTVMLIIHNRTMGKNIKKDSARYTDSFGKVFQVLIFTILPVILSTTIYNISDTLDQGIFNHIMTAKGLGELKATLWGIFSTKYKVLTSVPIALASAVCSSMMPSLTACVEQGEMRLARHKVSTATRFTMILAIPCAVGLSILGRPILTMLRFSGDLDMPARLLQVGSVSVIFYSLSTLSNGVLQGINQMRIPVRNAAIALILHLGVLYVMLAVFDWKLYGVVFSCIIFAFLMCVLNWMSIKKYLHYRQEIKRTFIIPLIASGVMALFVWLLNFLLSKAVSNIVSVLLSIFVGACIYFVVLVLLRGVRESEIRRFPGGGILVKIVKLLHLL
ncbi:MAG: polysaccharide biosynthesis protein [Lachnospiraceae bacterium]